MHPFTRIVGYRNTLSHHCTLFGALRNPENDHLPRRQLDYEVLKDWCKQERNWTYDCPPCEVEELLEILKTILPRV